VEFIEIYEDNIDLYMSKIDYFFKENQEDHQFFIPHDLSWGALKNIILTKSKDVYLFMCNEKEEIIGYGMLRGWDEGYEIPSLGILISKHFRGKGYSTPFMNYLHRISKERGAKKIRLTVFKENKIAVSLYNKLGYEFSEKNDLELIGIKNL